MPTRRPITYVVGINPLWCAVVIATLLWTQGMNVVMAFVFGALLSGVCWLLTWVEQKVRYPELKHEVNDAREAVGK